jgi:hypothetical protein
MKGSTLAEDSLILNVVVPQCCVAPICVSPSFPLGSIQEHFPGRCFIYRGQLLDENQTFAFYGMKSKDSMVALPANRSEVMTERWATITRDSETFYDMIQSLMEAPSRSETLRIQDLRAMRLESRPRQYRRFLTSFAPSIDLAVAPMKSEATVIPKPPEDVSTEALPDPWRQWNS